MVILTCSKVVAGEVIGLGREPIDTVLLNCHVVKLSTEHLCLYFIFMSQLTILVS